MRADEFEYFRPSFLPFAHRGGARYAPNLHRENTRHAFAVFFACCGLIGYGYLLVLGPPAWLPGPVDGVLTRLPGL